VLQQVASALRACCRSYDTLARFGGDEFAILMPCKGPEDSTELAAVLRSRLEGVSYRPDGYDQPIPLNLSVGLALFPQEGTTRLSALEIADDRLRRAKTGGDEDGLAERVRATLNRSCEGFSMLDALVTAVDNKDRYTRRHSEDVMRYCLEIAQALGLNSSQMRSVEMAALIHDVGKIGVPDHILRKPGQLTDEEFAAIKQHPIMGAIIAEAVPGFENTLDAIRHHHERWDGQGYPFGLAGPETPLIARLMAVADSFSAMTTDRPYRKGMPHEKALSILEKGAGTQWDPECVAAFVPARQAALFR
jgi:HD-GYP domain-containing protein (c-di-GMP phosphodiesterase class II)